MKLESGNIKQRWQEMSEKVDALTSRERALVLFTTLALVYLCWDFLLYSPVAAVNKKLNEELAAKQLEVNTLLQEERVLQQTVNFDPDLKIKKEKRDIEEKISQQDESLAALSVGLVPVDQLASILQEVLNKTGRLQLQNMTTLPIEEIQIQKSADSSLDQSGEGSSAQQAGIYKHSVGITIKGSYFELLRYLQELESMDWRFYWDELNFEQDKYPLGVFELKVYTLSTDEGNFGV